MEGENLVIFTHDERLQVGYHESHTSENHTFSHKGSRPSIFVLFLIGRLWLDSYEVEVSFVNRRLQLNERYSSYLTLPFLLKKKKNYFEGEERENKVQTEINIITNAHTTVTVHICTVTVAIVYICTVTVAIVHKCTIMHKLVWVFFLFKLCKSSQLFHFAQLCPS